MKKHEILNILRMFCIFRQKAITETQNLLHNILFETEKGSKLFLSFKFGYASLRRNDFPRREHRELVLKIENDEEVKCTDEWPDSEYSRGCVIRKCRLKTNVLNYFRNQLYLLGDICYKNLSVLESIKDMFPIPAVIYNLASADVDPIAKIGLARMLTSLFENTENLLFISKPKLQQLWKEDSISRGRSPKFMTPGELEKMKELIESFFSAEGFPTDPSLHCELLRFLSYLIRCDFVFEKADSNKDWTRKLEGAYRLILRAFFFCCKYLESLSIDRDPRKVVIVREATSSTVAEDSESAELPQFAKSGEEIPEAKIRQARKLPRS